MVMDARGQDGSHSQSERPGNKRPWGEERSLSKGNTWHGTLLPPIDAAPLRRPPQPQLQQVENHPNSYSPYSRDFPESEAKRPKYDRNEYRGSYELNGQLPPSRPRRKSSKKHTRIQYIDD